MIVLFTSMPTPEGTVQFLRSFADALIANGEDVRVFSEKGVCDDVPGHIRFDHVKLSEVALHTSKRIKDCAKAILDLDPKTVIFTDGSLGGAVMRRLLSGRARCVLVQHDPESHPTNYKLTPKDIIRSIFSARWLSNQDRYIDGYLLLSKTSKKDLLSCILN